MESKMWRRHKEEDAPCPWGLDPELALAASQMLISPKWAETVEVW